MSRRRKRVRERWAPGTVLWQVPIRFYDNPPPKPERCTVIEDDRKYDYEDEYSTYAFHDGYGHNVYLNPDDLYETLKACKAEIARRRAAHEAEHEADVEEIMASIDAGLKGRDRTVSVFAALQRSWQKEDKRDPNRFKDATRFAPRPRKTK